MKGVASKSESHSPSSTQTLQEEYEKSQTILAQLEARQESPTAKQQSQTAIRMQRRNFAWLLTYSALFTSLLAFFILIIGLVELEGSTPKRNYQKLVQKLYIASLKEKKNEGLGWVNIENTLSKGVKFSFSSEIFQNKNLFNSARAKVNPRFVPYFVEFAELIKQIQLKTFPERNQKLIKEIEAAGLSFKMTIRVEGHTDSSPLAKGARFANNVELSTFRAYAVMELLRIYTGLPKSFFSIAGYGSFKPLTEDASLPENRRVEIYLLPKVMEKAANVF